MLDRDHDQVVARRRVRGRHHPPTSTQPPGGAATGQPAGCRPAFRRGHRDRADPLRVDQRRGHGLEADRAGHREVGVACTLTGELPAGAGTGVLQPVTGRHRSRGFRNQQRVPGRGRGRVQQHRGDLAGGDRHLDRAVGADRAARSGRCW